MKRWIMGGLLCFLAICFAACGPKTEENTPKETSTDPAEITYETVSDIADVTIIRAEKPGDVIMGLVMDVRAALEEKTGKTPKLGTDWVGALDGAREIIIGEAKRPEYESLFGEMRGGDFLIRTVEGRTYIMAAREDMLKEAVSYFIENFIDAETQSLRLPTDAGYKHVGDYIYDTITVAGTPLRDYQITFDADDYTLTLPEDTVVTRGLADEMNDTIGMRLCGDILPVVAAPEEGGHYIILSAHDPIVNNYSVEVKDGNIYLTGSYHSIRNAVAGFYEDLLGCDLETGASTLNSRKVTIKNGTCLTGSAGLVVPYDKQGVLDYLAELYEDPEHVLSGTHAYGSASNWNSFDAVSLEQEKTLKASGQYAAIIEVDISFASSLNRKNKGQTTLTDYDLSQMVSESMEHVAKGGIMGVCCHLANPVQENVAEDESYFRGNLGTDETVAEMLTEGTELNENFHKALEPTLRLLAAYRDNGIPVIFRPLHEMSGSWFWWCAGQGNYGSLSQESMANMWRYIYRLVAEEMECTEVIWAYGPNFGTGHAQLYAYPGDAYVDLVGFDWYTMGNYEIETNDNYEELVSTGKTFSVFEFGPYDATREGSVYHYTCKHLRDDLEHMLKDGYKLAYFQCWAGSLSIEGMRDGDILMNDPMVLTREDAAAHFGVAP